MIHLVLLHGNLGSAADWEPCLPWWEENGIACHPVDLWELLASGPLGLEAAGERICALAPAGEPRVLAGYSLGGRLALHAVAPRPGFWDGLVLLSTHPGLAGNKERARRLEADLRWAERCLQDSPADFLAQWNAQSVFAGGVPCPRAAYDPQRVSLAFDCWSLGRQRDWSPWLSRTTLPLLWLTGERDARFTAMAAACRPDVHRILPGAGHRLLRDSPAPAARHVLDFLLSLPCAARC